MRLAAWVIAIALLPGGLALLGGGLALLGGGLALLGGSAAAQGKGDKALGEYLGAECVTCHQLSGKAVGAIPPIVGVDAESLAALMNAYRKKERENQVMQTIAAKFSDEEIAALAAYFESIKPKP
jgi:cytochrome c553